MTKIKGLPLPEEEKDFFDEETLKRIQDNDSEDSRFKDVKLKTEEETEPENESEEGEAKPVIAEEPESYKEEEKQEEKQEEIKEAE